MRRGAKVLPLVDLLSDLIKGRITGLLNIFNSIAIIIFDLGWQRIVKYSMLMLITMILTVYQSL